MNAFRDPTSSRLHRVHNLERENARLRKRSRWLAVRVLSKVVRTIFQLCTAIVVVIGMLLLGLAAIAFVGVLVVACAHIA
jgi:hypothetical protein